MKTNNILNELIDISILLSSIESLNELLDIILLKARKITKADAGSIYLKDNNNLRFLITQNDTLDNLNAKFNKTIPIDMSSIAGYVASTGEIVNIDDVYSIDDKYPFHYNKEFDKKNNYRCKSMLVIPLIDNDKNIIGVLQLINAKDENNSIIPFKEDIKSIVNSFASMAGISIKNMQLKENLKQAYLDTIYRLSVAAEFKDTDTGLHIKRMSKYSYLIAKELNMDKKICELILYASPLHDIGKIGIPDRILTKPAKLNDNEWEIMKKHTDIGYEILKESNHELLQLAAIIALNHHERFDGKGYPNGKKGQNIPIEGRIVALADVFDALSSKRPYKDPWPIEKILDIIKEEKGKQFDPDVVDAFFNTLEHILKTREEMQD